ncbi:OmpA family protein [Marinobacter salinisoli]|uniref:OmpA family protein n=1 Tax=Marinobacter salinisoli TaxID=2769486 RepID=A0ABX7MYS1_9GAMM|nr:OmpA family protein [Marinobacter salinisoli]QSP95343.1 OmpA family protein [Marinobacter salinisoli]
MTVLVLDNPELFAQAASLAAHLNPTPNAGAPRPHRMKFHYGFNKHGLSDADLAMIGQHALYLRQNPGVVVRIHGHSDNFGAEDYNQFLSRLRAHTVARLLLQAGVGEAQILQAGWGSSRPLATPEDHAANRRVELEYLTHSATQALPG